MTGCKGKLKLTHLQVLGLMPTDRRLGCMPDILVMSGVRSTLRVW